MLVAGETRSMTGSGYIVATGSPSGPADFYFRCWVASMRKSKWRDGRLGVIKMRQIEFFRAAIRQWTNVLSSCSAAPIQMGISMQR